MNILGISTGGFHLYAQAYAAAYAMKRLSFDKIIGGSAGAWIAIACAVHGPDKVVDIIKKVDLKDAYKFIPFTEDGKIKLRAVARFALGKSLAVQDDCHMFDRIISEKDFNRWKGQKNAPDAYAVTIELNKNKTFLWDLKKCTHKQASFAVRMSGRMQGIAKGEYSRWKDTEGYHVDAGARDHVQTHLLIDDHTENLVSIYSWPENWQLPSTQIHPHKGAIQELFRVIGVANWETAQGDMDKEKYLCDLHGVKRYQIFMERLKHSFDSNKQRQQKTINSALISAQNALGHLKIIQ